MAELCQNFERRPRDSWRVRWHIETLHRYHFLVKEVFYGVHIFVFYSPIMVPVWNLPSSRLCDYAVRCKRCAETIPAPVQTMPDTWIVATCPLCGERRRYLPTDIFRGRLSHSLTARREHVCSRCWPTSDEPLARVLGRVCARWPTAGTGTSGERQGDADEDGDRGICGPCPRSVQHRL